MVDGLMRRAGCNGDAMGNSSQKKDPALPPSFQFFEGIDGKAEASEKRQTPCLGRGVYCRKTSSFLDASVDHCPLLSLLKKRDTQTHHQHEQCFYSVPQNSFPLPTGSILSFVTLGFSFRKRLRRGNRYFILRNAQTFQISCLSGPWRINYYCERLGAIPRIFAPGASLALSAIQRRLPSGTLGGSK